MTAGRPTILNDKIAKDIFDRLANGEPTRAVCNSLGVTNSVFWTWIDSKPEFQERYRIAKERCIELLGEQMLTIADDNSRDEKVITGWDGKPITVADNDYIQRAKLRVDTRKWVMSKLAPKKYGDKQTTELTGKDGKDLPISILIGNKEIK